MKHTHNFTRSKPNSTVETCSCGKFRHTEKNINPIIEEIKPMTGEKIMKFASNLVVSTKDQFGTKSVCNKHYIKDLHRHIGTFTIRECEYCKNYSNNIKKDQ